MKAKGVLIISLLAVLMISAWTLTLTVKEEDQGLLFAEKRQEAQEYANRGLYEKAVLTYQDALAIEDHAEARMEMLQNANRYYNEDPLYYVTYLGLATESARMYPKLTNFAAHVSKLMTEKEDYQGAYRFLQSQISKGLNSKVAKGFLKEVNYAYKMDMNDYLDFVYADRDGYAVQNSLDEKWGYINLDGTTTDYRELDLAMAAGGDNVRYLEFRGSRMLVDKDEVIQAYINFEPEKVGIYSEGLIPMKSNGYYNYHNLLGDIEFGSYDDAGSFRDGLAAVKENGDWYLIDKEGKAISKDTFEDIVIGVDGSHLQDKTFLAKKDGKYHLFLLETEDSKDKKTKKTKESANAEDTESMENTENSEETAMESESTQAPEALTWIIRQVDGFEADAVDCLAGGEAFAFKKDGLWGFADLQGQIIIEPQYKTARSFSNGLAAVSDGEKWGFIAPDGEQIYDYQFGDVSYFNKRKNCFVKTDGGKWQLLIRFVR